MFLGRADNRGDGQYRREAPLNDEAMVRHARSLAVRLTANGLKPLDRAGCPGLAFLRIDRRAQSLAARGATPSPAMEWLTDNLRVVEATARLARAGSGKRLPAVDGVPRVQLLMRELVSHGDAQVSSARLMMAVRAFDEVQNLSMEELWLIPRALTLELCAAFLSVARRVLAAQADRQSAEDWALAGARLERLPRAARSSAFYERALQWTHEQETPKKRLALEGWLDERGMGVEAAILGAHEGQAVDRLWLNNICATLRMLDGLRWEEAFRALSRAERTLEDDPAGVYPAMDEASQAAVRAQVACLSRASGIGEATVARYALRLAGAERGVCHYLYDDDGRRALLAALNARDAYCPRLAPDPEGKLYLLGVAVLAALIYLCLVLWMRSVVAAILALPVAWGLGAALVNFAVARLIKPKPLLKLDIERVPDDMRTLVTIPALLSGTARAEALLDELETLGCLTDDENVDFLLLGDFADAQSARRKTDEEILAVGRRRVAEMNARAGREKFHYLQRARKYNRPSGKWMGYERKRGALMALYALLLGGEDVFMERGEGLAGRFRYVLTVDAGTRLLPGTIEKCIGAIAHPLNRFRREDGRSKGYAVLQPRMELPASAMDNDFVRLMAGTCGVESYPAAAPDVYQDLTGMGIFGGKGIVDVRAFFEALDGALPEDAILSHDLLEGAIAGAGALRDVAFYDSYPQSPAAYLKRLERWTRGDWQLVPFLRREELGLLHRYMIADNLRRSLMAPSSLLLLFWAAWSDNPAALAVGLLPIVLPALLTLPRLDGEAWRRAVGQTGLLPLESVCVAGAICRALKRLKTGKNALEWLPSADAEGADDAFARIPGRLAAILLLPALINAAWIAPALGLALLFFVAEPWLRAMALPREAERLTRGQIAALEEIARDTWRFFATFVPREGAGLPPDNVQIDPYLGPARRTSPTNIGLYMASCLAARALGLVDGEEAEARLRQTVDTLRGLEKWAGQLYNWYDTETLAPLHPRYVSSVDSGNLAACLLLCAANVEDEDLRKDMEALARGMDFSVLYDAKRRLFSIGYDVENERMSQSHYDLLASESRILGYVALMLKQIPAAHWRHLGRPTARVAGEAALLSWSGTMFEYLMPELFLPAPPSSLIGRSNRAVVAAQRAHAQDLAGLPWGVSESGYYAFDMRLNYQYKAFGLKELALRANAESRVVAPYAGVLALLIAPGEAARNVERMQSLGFAGEYGLYEAVDASVEDAPYRVVYSHMAHHQGMILLSIANALRAQALRTRFMARPEARALSLLLEERPAQRATVYRQDAPTRPQKPQTATRRASRRGKPGLLPPDAHLLYGGGGTCFLTAEGPAFLRVNGVMANRFAPDPFQDASGLHVHVRLVKQGRAFSACAQRSLRKQSVLFDAGAAVWTSRLEELECKLTVCVSPEDGALYERVELLNVSEALLELDITSCFAVALAAQADMAAHPAFQNLFVESERLADNALIFRRRPRDGRAYPRLLHAVSGAESAQIRVESDLSRLVGREARLADPESVSHKLSETVGATLNPCSALRVRLALPAGQRRSVTFAIALIEEGDVERALARLSAAEAGERALQLSTVQSRAMLDFLGLGVAKYQLLQRASAFLLYPRLFFPARAAMNSSAPLDVRGLWALGISGDLPLIAAVVASIAEMRVAREALRAHEFYRMMGVWCDLVLINDYGNDYEQPVRDALREAVASSHLRELTDMPGGAFLLEGGALTAAQRTLLRAASAIWLEGEKGALEEQLRLQLSAAQAKSAGADKPMLPGAYQLPPLKRVLFNGWGGFADDFSSYIIDLLPGKPTPAPWCNLLVNDDFGALLSERGGGFVWRGNSRNGRLTAFANDPLQEGFAQMLYLREPATGRRALLLPGPQSRKNPFRVAHRPGLTTFISGAGKLAWEVDVFVDAAASRECLRARLSNQADVARELTLTAFVDFFMGSGHDDARWTRVTPEGEMCLARGTMAGVGYLWMDGAQAASARGRFLGEGDAAAPGGLDEAPACGWQGDACGILNKEIALQPGETVEVTALLGWAEDEEAARAAIARWPGAEARREATLAYWEELLARAAVETPDRALNAMANRFLPYQVLAGRVMGRVGLYQAGGAYGFRDQLQDMLSLISIDPWRVRAHILLCASRQFASGDVQHWWHPGEGGVRTRISDDMLFLPYVAAAYARETGDEVIFAERVPFLRDEAIPEGGEDWYGVARASEESGTLREHCLRAIRRCARFGAHGLPLMGTGDWNDGMNRVGARGQGESVWLGEFLSVVADDFAPFAANEADAGYLRALAEEMRRAVEETAWDGGWYRRAFTDEGDWLGSAENGARGCAIDAIAQCWAVAAGLERARCERAMEAVWERLVDTEHGLVRLLTPPFDDENYDPGYIRGYAPGIRENGGQYTHAACWVVMAYALLGQAERAWEVFTMLLPCNHARDKESAERYAVEPYAIAADVYGSEPHVGRGGWTWYTGAASWMLRALWTYLMGYERRGDKARLRALLPEKWRAAKLTVHIGASRYTLLAERGRADVTLDGAPVADGWISLVDDGQAHEAAFPPREG